MGFLSRSDMGSGRRERGAARLEMASAV
jgi:hypothetical protein